jgi:hypothetical protein
MNIIKYTLEKNEGAIRNGESRTKTIKTKNTKQNIKKMNSTDPTENRR